MSVFRFRLQRLLDQRVRVKEDAVKNLAARQTELRREELALARIQCQIEKRTQQIVSTRQAIVGSTSVDSHTLIRLSDYLRGLADDAETDRDSLFSQELAVDHAKARLDQAREHLAVCRREEEILTKFRDKLHQRFLQNGMRKGEIEQDETGNILYLARSSAQ
jgi:flagellar export protein FliJ